MRLKEKNSVKLIGIDGDILISRGVDGIPIIEAQSMRDVSYGNGWIHANDRQLHMMLTRIIMRGEASKYLKASDELIEVDRYIRRLGYAENIDGELSKLTQEASEILQFYCDGVNHFMNDNGRVFEFKLLKVEIDPWIPADIIRQVKAFTYLGLSYAQGDMEKLIVQMIQNGLDEDKLRALYPYLDKNIDFENLKKVKLRDPIVPEIYRWLDLIPRLTASNNWVVSGKLTKSGDPILCGDPHLEVNRLPAVWHEIVLRVGSESYMGVGIPGAPGTLIGRNNSVSWSATYSFMDMMDFRIEECKAGEYRRSDGWHKFKERKEIIETKDGRVIEEKIYENDLGILEGDPYDDGFYLVNCWSTRYDSGAGDIIGLLGVMNSHSVLEAQKAFKNYECSTYNWVIADVAGNIGYQMTGRSYLRPKGVTGLVPQPAWDKKYNSLGYVDMDDLPSSYNPNSGMIVTANQDLNYLGKVNVINLPMADYRSKNIERILKGGKSNLDVDFMKKTHYDLLSLQSKKFMDIISPFLSNDKNSELLRNWNFVYSADSIAATVFENIYITLLKKVFGDYGLGSEVVEYLMKETGVFNDYYVNFDNILLNENSPWFSDLDRDKIFQEAIFQGLNMTVKPYGKTRSLIFSNMLFGGKLPKFLGFDKGPIFLPGGRASIVQGQIFKSGGRTTSFSPTYRFIANMGEKCIYSNTAGGVSDRRFSKLYFNRTENWLKGIYSVVK